MQGLSDRVSGVVVGQLSSNNFHFQPKTDPLYLPHRKKKAQLFPFSQRRVTQKSLAVLRSPGPLLLTWVQQLPALGPLSDCKSGAGEGGGPKRSQDQLLEAVPAPGRQPSWPPLTCDAPPSVPLRAVPQARCQPHTSTVTTKGLAGHESRAPHLGRTGLPVCIIR